MKAIPNTNDTIVKALLWLVFWAGILYSIAFSKWFIDLVANPFALFLSQLIGEVILFLGFQIERAGTIITAGGLSLEIYYMCTGIYQMAGFMAAVLAFPTNYQNKIIGCVWGFFGIGILNLTRILSIFFVGFYFPNLVIIFHGVIWQVLMILFSLLLWMLWANKNFRAIRKNQTVAATP
jgi:exosortase/archaeosortase family protein